MDKSEKVQRTFVKGFCTKRKLLHFFFFVHFAMLVLICIHVRNIKQVAVQGLLFFLDIWCEHCDGARFRCGIEREKSGDGFGKCNSRSHSLAPIPRPISFEILNEANILTCSFAKYPDNFFSRRSMRAHFNCDPCYFRHVNIYHCELASVPAR